MATKLHKPVSRVVHVTDVHGVGGDITVTITEGGLVIHKGRRKFSLVPWSEVSRVLVLPDNAPARYTGNKLGWLVEQ